MLKKLLGALMFCTAANATTYSTDLSDLWWNPNESGWGANVIQQDNILFMTLFVYGSTGAPTWYVAPATTALSGFTFTGPLYQTTGPWFGGAFNPDAVGVRQVGTATFAAQTVTTATLSYMVDGVTVSKAVTRQTWRTNDLTGSYLGGAIGVVSGCPSGNGPLELPAFINVTHSGSTLTVLATALSGGVSCTYSGAYTQLGRMGSMSGTRICSDGTTLPFSAFEIEGGISGFTARGVAGTGTCVWEGRMGGLRRN